MKSLYDELQAKHRAILDLQGKITDEELLERIQMLIKNIAEAGEFIRNVRQRENLRGLLRYWGTWVYSAKGEYPRSDLKPFVAEKTRHARTISFITGSVLSLVAISIVALLLFPIVPIFQPPVTPTQMIAVSPPNVLPPIICPDGFWPDSKPAVYRWQSQTNDKQAVMQLKQLGNKFARASVLELQLNLEGTDQHKNAGEAFIDLRYDFPGGLKAPLNLEDVAITMAVYMPGLAAGTAEQPNGVQIFVKSQTNQNDDFMSEYGTWVDLTNNTDRWLVLSLTPARTPPPDGEMDPDFDPANIVLVGINIATQEGAAVNYSGPIWISDVCWQTP